MRNKEVRYVAAVQRNIAHLAFRLKHSPGDCGKYLGKDDAALRHILGMRASTSPTGDFREFLEVSRLVEELTKKKANAEKKAAQATLAAPVSEAKEEKALPRKPKFKKGKPQ